MRIPPSSTAELLKMDEGESLTVYRDSENFSTIGVGICVDHNVPGAGLLPEESQWIFLNRISLCTKTCERWFPWFAALPPARQAVFISMTYNLGLPKTLKFTHCLEAAGKGDWVTAAKEVRDSKWAIQLPERVGRLAEQLEKGVWI